LLSLVVTLAGSALSENLKRSIGTVLGWLRKLWNKELQHQQQQKILGIIEHVGGSSASPPIKGTGQIMKSSGLFREIIVGGRTDNYRLQVIVVIRPHEEKFFAY
jgi:hypothetical protein